MFWRELRRDVGTSEQMFGVVVLLCAEWAGWRAFFPNVKEILLQQRAFLSSQVRQLSPFLPGELFLSLANFWRDSSQEWMVFSGCEVVGYCGCVYNLLVSFSLLLLHPFPVAAVN